MMPPSADPNDNRPSQANADHDCWNSNGGNELILRMVYLDMRAIQDENDSGESNCEDKCPNGRPRFEPLAALLNCNRKYICDGSATMRAGSRRI